MADFTPGAGLRPDQIAIIKALLLTGNDRGDAAILADLEMFFSDPQAWAASIVARYSDEDTQCVTPGG